MKTLNLPEGVIISDLKPIRDDRGYFMEAFKEEWTVGFKAKQWNIVYSNPGALRGMRLHHTHSDYVVLFKGKAIYALLDLRAGSPTENKLAMVDLDGSKPRSVIIPPGVAHGFYFFEESYYVYCVTHYYDPDDEFGFKFDDPDANIPWPSKEVILTERDKDLPTLKEAVKRVPSWDDLYGSK
jgi:dTDP-4-dehydrorhamnose 3,5-epimerase